MKSLFENIDLITYKINFNYEKKAVYHTCFGIFISLCLYIFLIILIRYFSKDFINKTNPRVIYQETEFSENFTIPIKFILDLYTYDFSFNSEENLYNVTSTSTPGTRNIKDIYNQTNEFLNFTLNIEYDEKSENSTSMYLNFIDYIDIKSERVIRNKREYFQNTILKNMSEQKFNLVIQNKYNNYYREGIKFDNFNISIQPKMSIYFWMKGKNKLQDVYDCFFMMNNLDNIINVNNENFFKIYSKRNFIFVDSNLKISQSMNFNYGVFKLIDDYGFIFSEINEVYTLKKNYDSYINNLSNELIFQMEFSPVMKQYQRIYKKLQNVFADLGGLFNSLILLGNILAAQINKKKCDYDLINKTFFLENEDSDIKEILNKNINLNNINNNFYKNNKENFDFDNKSRKLNHAYNIQLRQKNSRTYNSLISSIVNNDITKLNQVSYIKSNNNPYIKNYCYDKSPSIILNPDYLLNEEKSQIRRKDDSSSRLNF